MMARPTIGPLFHFSGHGSTQPVTDPAAQIEPEPDGRDQVLLPRDAGLYDVKLQSIRNAIIDDELALALDAIRLKGAMALHEIEREEAKMVLREEESEAKQHSRDELLSILSQKLTSGASASILRRRLESETIVDAEVVDEVDE